MPLDIRTTKIDDNQFKFDVLDLYMADHVNATYYAEHEGDDEWQLLDEWGHEYGIVSFSDIEAQIESEEGHRASLAQENY
jgi:hypothetical protein